MFDKLYMPWSLSFCISKKNMIIMNYFGLLGQHKQ